MGDLVTIPEKISRRRKREDFIPRDPFWVVVDFDKEDNRIAVTRYSGEFEDIKDAENSNSICWCWRESYRLRPTGLNLESYHQQKDRAADNVRAAHDTAIKPGDRILYRGHPGTLKALPADNPGYLHEVATVEIDGEEKKIFFEDIDPFTSDDWLGDDDNAPGVDSNGNTLAFSL